MSNKILIAYFSHAGDNYVGGRIVNLAVGNTKTAANMIKELSEGDLFEIISKGTYSQDYHTCTEEAKKELKAGARPELTVYLDRIDDYDTIILGYPNWWGTMPMPVWTFLEKYDFSGKTILPLCTHEGSGMDNSEADIKNLCPGALVHKGLAIRGGNVNSSKKDIAAWLNK